MGRGPMNENQNVYFQARKKAAAYNERLWSREGAAELLGISVSTLADYELGNTKVVPVDKVVLMADLYKTPELITGYCMRECPGTRIPTTGNRREKFRRNCIKAFAELQRGFIEGYAGQSDRDNSRWENHRG